MVETLNLIKLASAARSQPRIEMAYTGQAVLQQQSSGTAALLSYAQCNKKASSSTLQPDLASQLPSSKSYSGQRSEVVLEASLLLLN